VQADGGVWAEKLLVNRHGNGTPYRHPKGTPFVTARSVLDVGEHGARLGTGWSSGGSDTVLEAPALVAGFERCDDGSGGRATPPSSWCRQIRSAIRRTPSLSSRSLRSACRADSSSGTTTAHPPGRTAGSRVIEDDKVLPVEIIGQPPWRPDRLSASSLLTRSPTLKNRPRTPSRMQARAMAIARCDLPVPVQPGAYCQYHDTDGRIFYLYHPRHGQSVEILKRQRFAGTEVFVVRQPDGT
jgi:hypothetical protein